MNDRLRELAQAVVDAFPPVTNGTPRGDALVALREYLASSAAPRPEGLDAQTLIEAAPTEEEARMVYHLTESEWFRVALGLSDTGDTPDGAS